MIIQVITYLLYPVLITVVVLSNSIFHLLFKSDWWPVVPYLQLLCIVGLIYPLHSINLNILKVKGRSDIFLFLEIIKKIIIVFILFVSIPFGIFGILVGQIIGSILCYIPNCYFSTKLINYPIHQQLLDFIPTLTVSLFMGIIMHMYKHYLFINDIIYVSSSILFGFIFYVGVNYLFQIPGQLLLRQIILEKFRKVM